MTTRFQAVDDELVALLEGVWAAALARTQDVTEVRDGPGPDGSRIVVHRADAVFHYLWHNGRRGLVLYARDGSALGDLLAVRTFSSTTSSAPRSNKLTS